MKNSILAAVALLVSSTVPAATPESAVTGQWQGHYYYPYGDSAVEFTLNMVSPLDNTVFFGTTREPNTFGDPKAAELSANIVGGVNADGTFTFNKQYDSSGGVTHAVRYEGEFAPDHNSARGKWFIGEYSGTFEIHRAP